MADFTVQMTGLTETQAAFDFWYSGFAGNMQAAIDEAVDACYADARNACPVGTPASTGNKNYVGGTLKASISKSYGNMQGSVSTGVDYSKYVEFGTYKMAAQPYLMPAFDAASQALLSALQALK